MVMTPHCNPMIQKVPVESQANTEKSYQKYQKSREEYVSVLYFLPSARYTSQSHGKQKRGIWEYFFGIFCYNFRAL